MSNPCHISLSFKHLHISSLIKIKTSSSSHPSLSPDFEYATHHHLSPENPLPLIFKKPRKSSLSRWWEVLVGKTLVGGGGRRWWGVLCLEVGGGAGGWWGDGAGRRSLLSLSLSCSKRGL
ncbi:hypothetical protein Hdeb2414_s0015g00451081 [Helianthus debilis subsp. tardiflorus]